MSKKATAAPAPAIEAGILPLLNEWQEIAQWLEKAKAREMELRKQLASHFFPNPTEGVNRILTADGYEIALEHKINRKLDEQALDAVMAELPETSPYRQMGVLIAYKPTLVLSGLRTMPADEKLIFSQALTETPGSPTLAVSKPEVEGLDPATAPAVPDWPATATAAPAAPAAPATPIMDAYEAEKAKATAKAPAKRAAKSATGKAVKSSKAKK